MQKLFVASRKSNWGCWRWQRWGSVFRARGNGIGCALAAAWLLTGRIGLRFPDNLTRSINIPRARAVTLSRIKSHPGKFAQIEMPVGIGWLDDDFPVPVNVAVLFVHRDARPTIAKQRDAVKRWFNDDVSRFIDEAPFVFDLYGRETFAETVSIEIFNIESSASVLVNKDGFSTECNCGESRQKNSGALSY